MLDSILSVFSGGLLGAIGAIGTKVMEYKMQGLKFTHEKDMAEQDRMTMEKEMALAKIQGTIDLELQESESDAKNLQAAIRAEGTITETSLWVANLRGSTRPLVTYGLILATLLIIVLDMSNPWANEFLFMSTTAVTFWFGSRPMSRK